MLRHFTKKVTVTSDVYRFLLIIFHFVLVILTVKRILLFLDTEENQCRYHHIWCQNSNLILVKDCKDCMVEPDVAMMHLK